MAKKQRNYHNGGIQAPLFTPNSDWSPPSELPDLRHISRIALDRETKDDGLSSGLGPGWAWGGGHVCGISVAWREGGIAGGNAATSGTMRSFYAPIRHPDTPGCFDKDAVARWEIDHQKAGVRFVMQNCPYDVGFGFSDLGVPCPPNIDDAICMAYMVDENRPAYDLDSLCAWRGLPGKDETLLREALSAYGWPSDGKGAKNNLWRMPARYVGPYAEIDAVRTLELAESLDPEIDRQGVRQAYQLEMDLLPLVHEMRRRGIRVDLDAAEIAYKKFKLQSAEALEELTLRLDRQTSIEDVRSYSWLEMIHTDVGVKFPRAPVPGDKPGEATGRGIFDANVWMRRSEHWLPRLIVRARSREDAAEKFIRKYICGYATNGRIHASINQFKSEDGGTRTYRFSYADPPLQQTPSRDDDTATDIRGCFLPEDGEWWLRSDISQQEFRLDVHFSEVLKLSKANEAGDRYRRDPDTDFHRVVADMVGMERNSELKAINFARSYGAGIPKIAGMINKSIDETTSIMATYNKELPFIGELADRCQSKAERTGFIRLLDGARIHYDDWEPRWLDKSERARGWGSGGKIKMDACGREEALARVANRDHPWFGKTLRRANTRKAMSGLIQGSAARQTKRWMKLCWDAGHIPLIQVHDELCFSVDNEKPGIEIADMLRGAFDLRVPFQVGIGYGKNWGDADHAWKELK